MRKILLLATLVCAFILSSRLSAEIPNGKWANDSFSLAVNLDNQEYPLSFSEEAMDGFYTSTSKLISKEGNTATFLDTDRSCKIILSYNPTDKTIRVKCHSTDPRIIYNIDETFSEKDSFKFVVLTEDRNVEDKNGKIIGKVKAGDCLSFNWKILYFGTPCKDNAMLMKDFPKEWITFDKNENAQIILEFEPIGNGMMKVIETTMWAPLPNGSIPMAGVISYIGTVHENKLTLTKSGGMDVALSDNPADFKDMESPEEIIYIPDIYDGILFDGNKFHAYSNNF